MKNNDIKKAMYQMPVHFGPALGPRQSLSGGTYTQSTPTQTKEITVIYETDEEKLQEILPDNCKVLYPLLGVRTAELHNVAWLAGRGYNLTMILIPITFQREETKTGFFVPVIWENHGDPIITGREQIGWNKIYGQVSDLHKSGNLLSSTSSSWDFPFLALQVDLSKQAESLPELQSLLGLTQSPDGGFFHHKYIPKTGDGFNEADAEYMTFLPFQQENLMALGNSAPEPPFFQACAGTVAWRLPKWEDMPTQFRIGEYFACLPVRRYIGATYSLSYSSNDLMGQRIIK